MKLENQVCSLDLAKRLKELGVKQESLFYWSGFRWPYDTGKEKWELYLHQRTDERQCLGFYSAFTVAELGEFLPQEINVDKKEMVIKDSCGILTFNNFPYDANGRSKRRWYCDYFDIDTDEALVGGNQFGKNKSNSYKTEADARAKMLIYLLENKLI